MSKSFLLFIFLLSGLVSISQVNGIVTDDSKKPLPSATLFLLKAPDSALVKAAVADKEGYYSIPVPSAGNYLIKASSAGFVETYSAFTYNGEPVNLHITVDKKVNEMNTVVVKATKPPIEVRADKMIYNVEANAAATGLDGMELLRQAPGVMVDHEDNVSIAGKGGVQIFIDGKPSPLTGRDLTNYLRSMRSSSIEAIEIINNPSAKYDAAGTGGIINIKLKKNNNFGTNGSVNSDYQQGIYYPKFNAGFGLNSRNKNLNIFGNYNYTRATNVFNLDVTRDILDTVFEGYMSNVAKIRAGNFKAGVDRFLNKFSTIGFLVSGNVSSDDVRSDNLSLIRNFTTFITDRRLVSNNTTQNERKNINYNLNYVYQNPNGRNLTIDADYGMYRLHSENYQPNEFYDSTGTIKLYERNYYMITPTEIDIFSLKSDYEQNLGKGRLGVGFKSTVIRSDNDFQSYFHTSTKMDYDSVLSNQFRYTENINAVYTTFNQSFKGFQVMVGLRLEQTVSEGSSSGFKKNINDSFDPYEANFDRNLLNLFPSMVLTLNKNPNSQWTFSYSRRINRPSYQDMNPFEKRASEYGGFKGNPNLMPELAHSMSLINVYKTKLVTSFSYTYTDNVIVNISDTFNGTKSFYFPKNLASQKNLNFNINYSYSKKVLSFNTGLTAFYVHNNADFGPGRAVNLKVASFTTFVQPNVKTGKGWSFMSRIWYNSPQVFRGTMKMHAQFGTNAGLQKMLFKDAGTLRINYNDVFNTVRFYGTSDFGGQNLEARAYWEPRRLIISMSYRFGSNQVKSNRQRRTGIEDENSRTRESQ